MFQSWHQKWKALVINKLQQQRKNEQCHSSKNLFRTRVLMTQIAAKSKKSVWTRFCRFILKASATQTKRNKRAKWDCVRMISDEQQKYAPFLQAVLCFLSAGFLKKKGVTCSLNSTPALKNIFQTLFFSSCEKVNDPLQTNSAALYTHYAVWNSQNSKSMN